jgi:flagellar motor protein MotB
MQHKYFLLLFILLLPYTAYCQKYKEAPAPTLQSSSNSKQTPAGIHFKNINKIPYYYNARKLALIKKLEKQQQYQQLLPILQTYIGNFGIENFYKDTPLLWRLGQLHDRLGNKEQAKVLYRMVLKHHRTDASRVQSYYDSLEQNTKDYYVPLQYYYELVEYRKSVASYTPPKGVYLNMGNTINSEYEDYGPTLNLEEDIFIFTSRRSPRTINSPANEDIYFSKKMGENWVEAESFGKPINSIYNEGSATLSRDGNTLYFARCDSPDGLGNCDLFVASKLKNGNWGNVKNLGKNVNSTAWDSQPTLSTQEDTLYFASDRLGGFGLSDIYFTYKTRSGEWAPAQNMGPVINTRQSEVSPFYHPKYQVLYFSSQGQLYNFGDFDIYKTNRVRGQWQEPKNLGPLVNGKGSEYYFTIDADSKKLYYARSEAENLKNLDLFSFPLPMEAHPFATTKLRGVLHDSVTNKVLTGIVSVLDMQNGIEVSSKFIRPDGTFEFDLIDNSRYILIIQSSDFFTIVRELELKGETSLDIITSAISNNMPLVFQNIEFDQGKHEIKTGMHSILDEVALFLTANPNYTLEIAGHTDLEGDSKHNLDLSQLRANEIKEYIISKINLAENRIKSYGYGSSKPIVEEKSDQDKRMNRRVEFKLTKQNDSQDKF